MRSGTVPTPLCVGLGAACEVAMQEMDVIKILNGNYKFYLIEKNRIIMTKLDFWGCVGWSSLVQSTNI